jgi:hypothetical protein
VRTFIDQYNDVRAGMTAEEVTALLGEPDKKSNILDPGNRLGEQSLWTWRKPGLYVQLHFASGKVYTRVARKT